MLDFRRKNKIKKIVYSPFFLVFLTMVFVFLLKVVYGVYIKDKLSHENLQKEQVEYGKLIVRQNNLAKSLEYLKTEEGMESEIRAKFRAIKEGEKVVVIIDELLPPIAPATTTIERGFWYNLFH